MAKTKRKWIILDWTNPDALRAQDIPFNDSESIQEKVDGLLNTHEWQSPAIDFRSSPPLSPNTGDRYVIQEGGSAAVIGVDQGTKTFTLQGNVVSLYGSGVIFKIKGSTANNAWFTSTGASLNGSDTDVVAQEAIPDNTVDGTSYHLGSDGGVWSQIGVDNIVERTVAGWQIFTPVNGTGVVVNSDDDAMFVYPDHGSGWERKGFEWLKNGNDIYNVAGGNVGVGIADPFYKLQVLQTADNRIAKFGTSLSRGSILIEDSNDIAYVITESNKMSLGMKNSLDAGNLNIDVSGNVGIGITNPSAKLVVVQDTDGVDNKGINLHSASGHAFSMFRETGADGAVILRNNGINTLALEGGNVGIGIASPVKKLHVEDEFPFFMTRSGLTDKAWAFNIGSGTGDFSIKSRNDDGGAVGTHLQVVHNGNLLLNPSSGNVGIGVADPDAKLEVNGQIKITGGVPGAGKVLQSDANGLATWETFVGGAWTEAGGEAYYTGNVGIGTNNPGDKLHVWGSNGQVMAGDYGSLIVERSTADTAGTAIQIRKSRGAGVIVNGDEFGSILFRGYDGDSWPNGAAIIGLTDGTQSASASPGKIEFHTTSAGSQTLAQRMVIRNDGNVGIGTANPKHTLSLGAYSNIWANGGNDLKIMASMYYSAGFKGYGDGKKPTRINLYDGEISFYTGTATALAGATATATEAMRIIDDGKVGIGTTIPSSLLHLQWDGPIHAIDTGFIVENLDTGDSGTSMSLIGNRGGVSQEAKISERPSDNTAKSNLFFETHNGTAFQNALILKSNQSVEMPGDVGIGTNTPARKLTVRTVSSNNQFSFGRTTTSAGYVNMYANGTAFYLQSSTDDNSYNNLMTFLHGGDIGIGVTAPSAKFDMYTSEDVSTALTIAGRLTNYEIFAVENYWGIGQVDIKQYGITKIHFNAEDGSNSYINSGNVGIGTTNPSRQLHVENIGGTSGILIESGHAFGTILEWKNSTGGTSNITWDDTNDLRIINTVNSDDADIIFRVKDANEAMRIKGNNNIGIGITNPSTQLHLAHATGNLAKIRISRSVGLPNTYLEMGTTGGSGYIAQNGGSLHFQVADPAGTPETKMSISEEGLYLKPTGQPSVPVAGDIIVDTTQSNMLKWWDGASWRNNAGGDFNNGGDTAGANRTLGNNDNFSLALKTNNLSRITILNNGNVGVGEANPTDILQVRNDTNSSTLQTLGVIQNPATTQGSAVTLNVRGETSAAAFSAKQFGTGLIAQFGKDNDPADLVITNSGSVGIGITIPYQELHIKGSSPHIRLSDSDATTDEQVSTYLEFYRGDNTSRVGYMGYGSLGNEDMYLYNETSGGSLTLWTNSTEQMRIEAAGNVGVGTNNPGGKFHVRSASSGVAPSGAANEGTFENNADGGISILTPAANKGVVYFGSPTDSGRGIIAYDHFADLFWMRAGGSGTNDFVIDSGGNIGIGTVSPQSRLHIVDGTAWLKMQGTTAGAGTFSLGSSESGGSKYFSIYDQDNTAHRLFISSVGKIGMGVADPNQDLQIQNAGAPSLSLTSSNATASYRNWGIRTNSVVNGDFDLRQSDARAGDPIAAGTTRFYIDESGNVGIGTQSPGEKFHVEGGNLRIDADSNDIPDLSTYTGTINDDVNLMVTNANASATYAGISLRVRELNSSAWNIYNKWTGTATGDLLFVGRNSSVMTERMRIIGTGNVGIGITNPAARLSVKPAAEEGLHITGIDNEWCSRFIGGSTTNLSFGALILAGTSSLDYAFRILDQTVSTEYFTVKGDGKVGIGTNSPTSNLVVSSPSGTPEVAIYRNENVPTQLKFKNSINEWIMGSGVSINNEFTIRDATDSRNVFHINGIGNVGIGTTVPGSKLDILGSMNTTYPSVVGIAHVASSDSQAEGKGGVISFGGKHNDAGDYTTFGSIRAVKNNSTTGNYEGKMFLGVRTGTGADLSEVVIDSSGNVGIGTTNPATKLHVYTAGSDGITIGATSAEARLLFDVAGSAAARSWSMIASRQSYGDFSIEQGAALGAFPSVTRMHFKADGNVGIGVYNADHNLTIKDATTCELGLYTDNANLGARNWAFATEQAVNGDLILYQSDAKGGNPVTAGTSRMSFRNDGNIGIGINNPDSDNWGTGHRIVGISTESSQKAAHLNLRGRSSDFANVATGVLAFQNGSGTGAGASSGGIRMYSASTHATDPGAYMSFYTNSGDGGDGYQERMRINSYGQVDLTGDLRIGPKTSPMISLNDSAGNDWQVRNIAGDFSIRNSTTGNVPITLDSINGFVGINTATPGARMEILGSASTSSSNTAMIIGSKLAGGAGSTDRQYYQEILFKEITGSLAAASIRHYANLWDNGYSDLAFRTYNHTGGGTAEVMRITGNGNVGIKTASPLGTAHIVTSGTPFTPDTASDDLIVGSIAHTGISIQSGVGTSGRLIFARSGSIEAGGIVYGHDTDKMRFDTAGVANRMVIDGSGNVGIGTATPSGKLNVVGNTIITGTNSGAINLFAQYSGTPSNPGVEVVSQAGVTTFQHNSNGGATRIVGSLGVTGGENWFTGNVGIGTTNPDVNISVFGTIGVGYNTAADVTSSGYINLKIGNLRATPTNISDCFIGANDTGGPGSSAGDLIFMPRTSVPSSIRMFTGNPTPSERFSILSDGSVGIGTNSPAGKLDVNGDVYIRSSVSGIVGGSTAYVLSASGGANAGLLNLSDTGGVKTVISAGISYFKGGSVGIGTATPATELEVYGTTPYIQCQTNADNTAMGLQLRENGGSILGRFDYTGDYLRINAAVSRDIQLETTGGNVTLDGATGFLGIGVTNPDQLLQLTKSVDAGDVAMRIRNSAATGSTDETVSLLLDPGSDANVASSAIVGGRDGTMAWSGNHKGNLQFHTSNGGVPAEKMRIDAWGRVGIGMTSPATALHIRNTNPRVLIQNAFSATGQRLIFGTHASYWNFGMGIENANRLSIGPTAVNGDGSSDTVTGSTALTIHGGGYVGIGCTNPVVPLDINFTDGAADSFKGIALYNDATTQRVAGDEYGTAVQFYFDSAEGTDQRKLSAEIRAWKYDNWSSEVATNKNSELSFHTMNQNNVSERMRIDNLGNVGIGTTDPGIYKLNVNGIGKIDGVEFNYGSLYIKSNNEFLIGYDVGDASSHQIIGVNANNQVEINKSGFNTYIASDKLLLGSDTVISTSQFQIKDTRSGSIQMQRMTLAPSASTSDIDFGFYLDATSGNVAGTSARGLFNIDVNGANTATTLFNLRYNSGSNIALYARGDGKVAVGTNDPQALFEIESGHHQAAQVLLALTTRNNGSNNDSIAIDFRTNMALDGVERVGSRIESVQTNVTSSHYGELAFSTLQTGTLSEKMRIRSNGDIGIGTTNPLAPLSIGGAGGANGMINFARALDAANGDSFDITFKETTDPKAGVAMVYAGHTNPTINGRAYTLGLNTFNIVANSGAADLVAMTVKRGDGFVGVGNANPTANLHIGDGSANAQVKIEGSGTAGLQIKTSTSDPLAILEQWFGNEGTLGLYYNSTKNVQLRAKPDEYSFINSGNFGIGYTTPGEKLAVNGNVMVSSGGVIKSGSSGGYLLYQGGATYPGGQIQMYGGQNAAPRIAFHVGGATASPAERMRINSSGRVGIGTTDPDLVATSQYPSLHVHAATKTLNSNPYDAHLIISDGRTATSGSNYNDQHQAAMNFAVNTNGSQPSQMVSVASIRGGKDSTANNDQKGYLTFHTNNSVGGWDMYERMRIATDGSVGIGTIAPANLFCINKGGITIGTPSSYHQGFQINGTRNFTIGLDANAAYLQTWSSKPLHLNNQGNDVIVGGNGIFTSSLNSAAVAQLTIKQTANANPAHANLWFETGIGQIAKIEGEQAAANQSGRLTFWTGSNGAPAQKMTIEPSGKVGIGTNSPNDLLSVEGDFCVQSGTNRKMKVLQSTGQIYSDAGTTVTTPADLAEWNKVKGTINEYELGTVVAQSDEALVVEIANDKEKTYGVVTDRATFLGGLTGVGKAEYEGLNDSQIEVKFTAKKIGMVGHVKVKVTGKIKIGDRLVLSEIPGTAKSAETFEEKVFSFAIAREGQEEGTGLIEARLL